VAATAHLGVEVQLDFWLNRLDPEVAVAAWQRKITVDANAACVVVHVSVVQWHHHRK